MTPLTDGQTRDPRKNPKPGDIFRMADGFTIMVIEREFRRPNQIEYGLGRNIKEYVKYRLKEYPGLVCPQAVSGFLKRIKTARVIIHAAD